MNAQKKSWWKDRFTLGLPYGNKIPFKSGFQFVMILLLVLLFFKNDIRQIVGLTPDVHTITMNTDSTMFKQYDTKITRLENKITDIKFDKVSNNQLEDILKRFYSVVAEIKLTQIADRENSRLWIKTDLPLIIDHSIKKALIENNLTQK